MYAPFPSATLSLLGPLAKFRKATINFVISGRPTVRPSARMEPLASTGRIFTKFDFLVFFENLSRKSEFHYHLTRITDALHEDLCTFMTISRWILRTVRNVSGKSCKWNEAHVVWSVPLPPPPKIVPFLRLWKKNVIEARRPPMKYNTAHALCLLNNGGYKHTYNM